MVLAVCAFGLGFRGMYGAGLSLPDKVYGSIQILALNSTPSPELPELGKAGDNAWILCARVFAALVALLGTIELVRRCFDQVLQRQLIRAIHAKHVILAGLDEAALSLADDLLDSGLAVVAIDAHAANPSVTKARKKGILVHIGDPTDAEELAATHVECARWLIALGGDVRVATAARGLVCERVSTLTCLLAPPHEGQEIVEPRPMPLSQRWLSGCGFNVVQVNLLDRMASQLIAEVGLFRQVLEVKTPKELRAHPPRARRVLIVGEGAFCERLAGVLVWDGSVIYSDVVGKPMVEVTLVHPRARNVARRLEKELRTRLEPEGILPLEARNAQRPLEYVLGEDGLLFTEKGGTEKGGAPGSRFDLVIIHRGPNDRTLAAAGPLVRRLFQHTLTHYPVVVAVLEGKDGRRHALDSSEFAPGALAQHFDAPGKTVDGRLLYSFDAWSRTLQASRFFGPFDVEDEDWSEAIEGLARRVHWVYQNPKSGPPSAPAVEALWKGLDEEFRESSRQFARDIERKLTMIGCDLRRAKRNDTDLFEFTKVEIECLARAEHERWMVERWERGWRSDVSKSIEKSTSDHLKPWYALDEDIQDIDRAFLSGLQAKILAPEGFAVTRWPSLRAKPSSEKASSGE